MHLKKIVGCTCLPCSRYTSCLSLWNPAIVISPRISFVQLFCHLCLCPRVFLLKALQKEKKITWNNCKFWKIESPTVSAFCRATLSNFYLIRCSFRQMHLKNVKRKDKRSLISKLFVFMLYTCLYKYVHISLIVKGCVCKYCRADPLGSVVTPNGGLGV